MGTETGSDLDNFIDDDQIAEQLITGRILIYQFLSRAFEREADSDFLALAARYSELGVLDYEVNPSEDLELLAVDYCSIFILPSSHLAPYQSVQSTENELWGERAAAMSEYLDLLGMSAPKGFIPDHAAVELATMGQLVKLEAQAFLEHDAEDLNKIRYLQTLFRKDFLAWFPTYLVKMKDYAQTRFYQSIAASGLAFLLSEEADQS